MNLIHNKKIAVFLNAFWVYGKGMSGGDQMAIQIFARIRDSFPVLHWFTNPDGKQAVNRVVKEVTFSTTPSWFDRLPIGLAYILRTIHATISLFRKQVDIVYSGSDFFPDLLPAFFYTRFRPDTRWIQCIFHIYPDWHTRPGNRIVNFAATMLQNISLFLARHADGVVNINHEVHDALITRGYDARKLAIITPGVDLDLIKTIPPGNDQQTYDAVFLGRLTPSKGIFDLASIWKRVTKRFPNSRLAIIGGGSAEVVSKLTGEFASLGLQNNVYLLGYVETETTYAILKRARCFIFPSHEEGFGIVIVEAMACGVPVVAWKLPVYNELFGESIKTVPLEDIHGFADALIALMSNSEKNADMISQARQCAQRYSWFGVSRDMQHWLLGCRLSSSRMVPNL